MLAVDSDELVIIIMTLPCYVARILVYGVRSRLIYQKYCTVGIIVKNEIDPALKLLV